MVSKRWIRQEMHVAFGAAEELHREQRRVIKRLDQATDRLEVVLPKLETSVKDREAVDAIFKESKELRKKLDEALSQTATAKETN